ncbi:hypothetical protein K8R66_02000, partial [bacterium]|nr:hypothetical protein [bacterium]
MKKVDSVFNKFSKKLKTVLIKAQDMASSLFLTEVSFWEMLYVLSQEKGIIVYQLLTDNKIKSKDLKLEIIKKASAKNNVKFVDDLSKQAKKNFISQFSEESQDIIEKSVRIAYQRQHPYIGTEHLLMAILSSDIKELDDYFKAHQIDRQRLIESIENILLG